jgi:hypothetical protein
MEPARTGRLTLTIKPTAVRERSPLGFHFIWSVAIEGHPLGFGYSSGRPEAEDDAFAFLANRVPADEVTDLTIVRH